MVNFLHGQRHVYTYVFIFALLFIGELVENVDLFSSCLLLGNIMYQDLKKLSGERVTPVLLAEVLIKIALGNWMSLMI